MLARPLSEEKQDSHAVALSDPCGVSGLRALGLCGFVGSFFVRWFGCSCIYFLFFAFFNKISFTYKKRKCFYNMIA
jgi:hypothetical protein